MNSTQRKTVTAMNSKGYEQHRHEQYQYEQYRVNSKRHEQY
jgi:hypothetical protein